MRFLIGSAFGTAFMVASIAVPASAQQYPTKPISIISPAPPGAFDVYVRAIQQPVEKALGQPLILESKPGANGYIGARHAAQAPADGYTLLLSTSGQVVIGPLTSANAGFDIIRDFEPVIGFMDSPLALVVRSSLNINTLAELLAYAKANPGKLNYGTTGHGSLPHIYFDMIARLAGTPLTHVPYHSFPPMIRAIQGGEVDLVFVTIGLAQEPAMADKVKIIGVDEHGARRGSAGNVPDIGKVIPGFETIPVFTGMWAPAKTPKPIIDKLNQAANLGLNNSAARKVIEQNGSNVVIGGTPEQFGKIVRDNVVVTSRLVAIAKAGGMKFEE